MSKSFSYLLILILLTVLGVTEVTAAPVPGLYTAEVPVTGQGAEQRNQAIREAFKLVLIKVTGHRRVAERNELVAEIETAPRYVQQYRYRILEQPEQGLPAPKDPKSSEASAVGDSAGETVVTEPPRMLRVTFDRNAVDNLLRQTGMPIWGDNRPSGLVWMGLAQGGDRYLLQEQGELVQIVQKIAVMRGIPLLFPLMDLEDQSNLQVADLWGDFEPNIRNASLRYTPDFILTGKLEKVANGFWRSSWRLYYGSQVDNWEDQGRGRSTLINSGIEQVADLLAERFAPLGADRSLNIVRIRVDGVIDLQRYTELNRFIHGQNSVERLDLVAVEPDALIYDLQTRGGALLLQQDLELGGVLVAGQPGTIPDIQGGEGIDLYYRMR